MQARTRRRAGAVAALLSLLALVVAVVVLAGGLPDRLASASAGSTPSPVLVDQVQDGTARNVILLVGDGMGDSEITIARNYEYGAAGSLPGIDALPASGQLTTWSVDRVDGLPDYVTDSAAAASGWATGTKTYDGALSVGIDGLPRPTILEMAQADGLRTGDVSTAPIQDATPAALLAHVTSRGCIGPSATTTGCPTEALENGGLGSITEQLIETRADLVLGGGATWFDEIATSGPWEGKTLLAQATERGFQVVTDVAGLDAVDHVDQSAPLLGLFAAETLPLRWAGPLATPLGGSEPAVRCMANPARVASTPTLPQMTGRAIELLDTGGETGFFLQVEGASIDKADHAANPCGQIGETVDFDEAIQVALEFAETDGHTLVLVLADHAQSSQIVPTGTTSGLTRTLLTADDKPMTVSYPTTGPAGGVVHTGSQVRLAAYGPGADRVIGLTDQTDLFVTMREALGIDRT